MTTFWREYSDRQSHWATRDQWGKVTTSNPTSRAKDAWVYRYVTENGVDQRGTLYPNAKCPECQEEVYFYRHPSGGCAWFDDIPWPWPPHECMNQPGSKCHSGNPGLAVDGGIKHEQANMPRKPDWMTWPSKRTYVRHPDQASTVKDEIEISDLFGLTPIKRLKQLSEHQRGLRKVERAKLRSPFLLGLPHNQSAAISRYWGRNGASMYHYGTRERGRHIIIPLTMLRTVRHRNRTLLAARSFQFPSIGLWLQVDGGIGVHRSIHGLLQWNESTPNSRQITFLDPDSARLDFRKVLLVEGAFAGKLKEELESVEPRTVLLQNARKLLGKRKITLKPRAM